MNVSDYNIQRYIDPFGPQSANNVAMNSLGWADPALQNAWPYYTPKTLPKTRAEQLAEIGVIEVFERIPT